MSAVNGGKCHKKFSGKREKYTGIVTVLSDDNWSGKMDRVVYSDYDASSKKKILDWFESIPNDTKEISIVLSADY